MTRDVSIEDFRGGAEALESMAHAAWRDEYKIDSYPNLYRPDYLAYLMAGLRDPRLAIAAYRGEEIIGFMLNLPRQMALDGRLFRAALTCLLVVRKEALRRGVAQAMIAEGLRRNRELDFDFSLFYLETGHRSSRLFHKLKAGGAPVERVKRMHAIVRALDLPAIAAAENIKWYEKAALRSLGADRAPSGPMDPAVREAGPGDADPILELLNAHQYKVRLARVFSREEVVRELLDPPIARALVYEKGGRVAGVLAWVTVEHVGRTRTPWAWINYVSWDGLDFSERRALVRAFLAAAREQGSAGVVEWSKRCYPAGALYAERFVPYPRRVDMMAWRFAEGNFLADIPGVFEVQI